MSRPKIGIIGLGGIAQKAYLPVVMGMQQTVDWHLFTRDQNKLAEIGKQYGVEKLYASIEDLCESGIQAAFVHTATYTHSHIVKQLLEKGIHVYVDKPISEDHEEVIELTALAAKKQLLLVAGFNRRFAPMIQKLKEIPDKNMIFVQKTRPSVSDTVGTGVYDLFIHVLDTAIFLLDGPILDTAFSLTEENGMLRNCVVQLKTAKSICLASINYDSGANAETAEVHSPTGIHRVLNLTEYEITNGSHLTKQPFGDWEPVLERRGFAPLIRAFIAGVKDGKNPIDPESALFSHRLCHQIVYEANQKRKAL